MLSSTLEVATAEVAAIEETQPTSGNDADDSTNQNDPFQRFEQRSTQGITQLAHWGERASLNAPAIPRVRIVVFSALLCHEQNAGNGKREDQVA